MKWVKRHWEVVVPLILSIGLAIYELIEHIRDARSPITPEVFFWLFFVALVGISSQLSKLDKPLIDKLIYQLFTHADGNRYLEDHIRSSMVRLKNDLDSREFSTDCEGQSDKELVHALKTCQKGDSVNAISYRVPWATTFHAYKQENIDAVKRGVVITRIFVIQDYLDNRSTEAATNLWDIMKEQAASGVKVRYIKQSQIPRNVDFLTHDRGMVEFRYGSNNSVVMYETAPSALHGDRRRPLLITVSWKREEVEDEHKYFECLLNLAHAYEVEPTTTAMSPPWIKGKKAASAGTSSGGSDAASDTGLFTRN